MAVGVRIIAATVAAPVAKSHFLSNANHEGSEQAAEATSAQLSRKLTRTLSTDGAGPSGSAPHRRPGAMADPSKPRTSPERSRRDSALNCVPEDDSMEFDRAEDVESAQLDIEEGDSSWELEEELEAKGLYVGQYGL